MKKRIGVLSFVLSFVMLFTVISPSIASTMDDVKYHGFSLEDDLKEVEEFSLIEKIDEFVYVDDYNKFNLSNKSSVEKILSDNLEEANILFNPNNDILNPEEIVVLIENQLNEVNSEIEKEYLEISNNKNIVKKDFITSYAYGFSDWEHGFERYWWGVKHIFRTDRAASSFAQELQTTASMSAAATLLLNGFPPAAGATALTGIYLNQMANSINNKKNMYDKIFLNITYALVFSTGEHID